MQLIAEHDDVKARIELKNALQLNDDMIDAWRALGQLEERNKNLQAVYCGFHARFQSSTRKTSM